MASAGVGMFAMSDDFYKAFEDKHRGSRAIIKERLGVYLPFIAPLIKIHIPCTATDLGCGRGEWLELLMDHGVDIHGVDIDQHMLNDCHQRGLSVHVGDAVAYLSALADESQDIVSGFHIAEHLPFNQLQKLVEESLRVLKPAGLLILETPNSENILVGTSSFYLDPTHQKPIPSQLMIFLSEYYGFYRSKIIYLQESKELVLKQTASLWETIGGASPDYAVVAQKQDLDDNLRLFKSVFLKEYGLNLPELTSRFDAKSHQVTEQAQHAIEQAQQGKEQAQQASEQAQQATEQAQQATEQAQQATEQAQQATEQARHGLAALQAVYASTSWRITKPLRSMSVCCRHIKCAGIAWITFAPMSRPRRILRMVLVRSKEIISRHPKLKRLALFMLTPFPKVSARLKCVGRTTVTYHPAICDTLECEQLSPRARQIYHDIKAATDNNKGLH